jgi:hypothetical protein
MESACLGSAICPFAFADASAKHPYHYQLRHVQALFYL